MVPDTLLNIQLTSATLRPKVGATRLNEVRGGPEVLLTWLETQLGLIQPEVPKATRVTDLAAALDGVPDAVFAQSLATDRWATSSELLAIRDQLRMAGWGSDDNKSLPQMVRDLSRATAARPLQFGDLAMRLHNVLQALVDGHNLPPHRCVLEDPIELWPPAWRAVLNRMTVENSTRSQPLGTVNSALRAAQIIVNAGKPQPIVQDLSLRFVTTRSETAACEFVAATLAENSELLPETVVYCESDAVALRLDACLSALACRRWAHLLYRGHILFYRYCRCVCHSAGTRLIRKCYSTS